MNQFLNFTYKMCLQAFDSGLVPAAYVVCSLNMLIQILFSVLFGSKCLPKIRGYRG